MKKCSFSGERMKITQGELFSVIYFKNVVHFEKILFVCFNQIRLKKTTKHANKYDEVLFHQRFKNRLIFIITIVNIKMRKKSVREFDLVNN